MILLASDIHLEFGPVNLIGNREAEVLILAGDICEGRNLDKHQQFFKTVSELFKNVIWIAGNHEYYGAEFYKMLDTLKTFASRFKNLHFLDNNSVEIGDTVFFGSTLWTDCNKINPFTVMRLKNGMSDFAGAIKYKDSVRGIYRKFLPEDSYAFHKKALTDLNDWYKQQPDNTTKKLVVITHHLPHDYSVPTEFRNDFEMNGGFRTNLDEFIEFHQKINLWVHGHTHSKCDYQVHNTRIVCNPRGYYGKEHMEIDFQLKEIKLLDKY